MTASSLLLASRVDRIRGSDGTMPAARSITVTCPGDYNGAHSKFNIIEAMGNGQSALVLVTDKNGPESVY